MITRSTLSRHSGLIYTHARAYTHKNEHTRTQTHTCTRTHAHTHTDTHRDKRTDEVYNLPMTSPLKNKERTGTESFKFMLAFK